MATAALRATMSITSRVLGGWRLVLLAGSLGVFCVAAGITPLGSQIANAGAPRTVKRIAPLPLVLRKTRVRVNAGVRITGSTMIANVAKKRVRSTKGALSLRPASGGRLTGLAPFSVPALAKGAKKKVVLNVGLPGGTAPGAYDLMICLDVGSQIQRFVQRNNCRTVGKISVPGGGTHTPSPPPDTTLTSGPSGLTATSSAQFTFASTLANGSFQCSLDAGPWLSCTSPQRYGALSDGPHSFQVRAVNADGTVDPTPAQASWTVDTTAPSVTLTRPAGGSATNNAKPTFAGTAGTAPGDSSAITVKIYSGSGISGSPVQTLTATASGGSWSVAATTRLGDATYTARAEQSDSAGNTGTSRPATFSIKATAPAVSLTGPANGSSTNQSKPTFSGAAETAAGDSSTVTVKIYSGSGISGSPVQTLTTTASGGSWSVQASSTLADGTYTAQASQSDSTGSTGSSSASTFTIDTHVPAVTLTSPANGATVNQAKPTFSGAAGAASGDSSTITVKVYSGASVSGSPVQTLTATASGASWSVQASSTLADGTYTAQASQSDSAGSTGSSSASTFTINTTPGACTESWTGATSSDWSTATNWSSGRVPGSSDWACIPAGTKNLPVTLSSTETTDGLDNQGGLTITGSLTLTDTKTASTSSAALTLSGTLSVDDSLTAPSLTFGGTFDGPGKLTVPSGGSLVLQGGQVEAGSLVNNGSGSVPANASPWVGGGAKLVNGGSLSFAVGSYLTGACGQAATATTSAIPNGEFDNTGSVTTNGVSGTGSSPVQIGYPYNCLDTEDSGSLNVASGELDIGGANFNFNTGSTVTGAASSKLVLQGTVGFNASSTSLPEPVVLNGQTVGAGNVTAPSLTFAGVWNDSGSLTVPSGGSLVLQGGQVEAGSLVNNGSGSVPANASPWVGGGAKLVNGGSLSFAVGSYLTGACGQAATATTSAIPNGEFDNTGSVTTNGVSGTGSSPVQIGYPYNCLDTEDSGSLNVASGELDIGGANFNFNTGSTVTGAASSKLVLQGTVGFNASSTSLPEPVVLNGQTVGAGNVTAPSLTFAGVWNDSGSLTVPSGGSLVLQGGQVEAGSLVNNGSGSVPANASPWVGGGAKLVNGGSLSFAVGSYLTGACGQAATATTSAIPNGEFDNTGSVTTNGVSGTGSSPVQIGYPYNCLDTEDSGSLNVASGELDIGGANFNFNTGSTVTGAASSKLVLQGTVGFNASSTSLPEPVVLNGQTVGAGNVTAPSLTFAGVWNDSGSLTVPSGGSLVLQGGQVEAGSLVNNGSGSVPANASPWVGGGAKLVNGGSLSFAVGSYLTGACGQAATATTSAIPNGEFDNTGSVTTNGVSGTGSSPVQIGYPYNCLDTEDSGSLNVASGELDIGGANFNFNTGSTVTGAASSKLVLQGTVGFNASSTSLPEPVVLNGQTVGAGNVTAPSLTFAGVWNDSGSLTVPSGGSLVLQGGQVEAGSLVNNGSGSVPANASPWVGGGAKLVNGGSLSFAVGSYLTGACGQAATATTSAIPNGEFDNTGSVTTNGVSGTGSSPVQIGYPYNCLDTEDSGSLNVASGELDIGGANFNFNTGSTVTGAASSKLVLQGTVGFNASSTSLPEPVVLNGQTVGAGNVTAPSLTFAGVWNDSGSLTVPSGGSLVLQGGQVEAGSLVNNGSGSVPANASPWVGGGAKLVNGGSLSFAVGSYLTGACGQAATATTSAIPNGEFDNTGSVTTNGVSGTGSSPVQIGYPYNCLDTEDSGSLNVASGELDIGGANFNFNTGSTVTGAASSKLVLQGTVGFNASSTSLPEPVVLNGQTVGAGNVTAPSLTFAGVWNDSGSLTVPSGGSLVLQGGQVEAGSLVNNGSGSVPANASPWVGGGAKLVNGGSLSFAVGSYLTGACGQAATATTSAIPNGEFDNTGSVTTNGVSGTGSSPVQIGYPYNCLDTEDSGSLNVASGELDIGGANFNFNTGSTVTGAASSKLVLQGTVGFNASSTSLPEPVVLNGQTVGAGNVTAPSLTFAGVWNDSGSLTVPSGGSLVLQGGQVEAGSLVNNGSGSVPANASPWVGGGAKLVNGGSLSFAVGSYLTGACGQAATATTSAIPNGEFDNTGSVTTNGVSGTGSSPVQIGYPYNCLDTEDSGSLNVASGELDIGGANFNFNTGSTVTGAASSKLVLQGTVQSQLSSLGGIGQVTINGTLDVNHSLSLPPATFSGDMVLAPGAIVTAISMGTPSGTLELDGTGGFGQLRIGGAVNVSSLSVYFGTSGYQPGCGASITAVTGGSISGPLSGVSGGTLPYGTYSTGGSWSGSWQPTSSGTTAGGYVYCPPPPAVAPGTYGAGASYDSVNPSGYQAEPVNTATGAYNTTETDASVPGLGVPMTFTRSYTSLNPYSGPLGPGWTDSMNVFLTQQSGGVVVLNSEDGQQTTYTQNSDGTYSGSVGAHSVLTSQSGGGWLLVRQNQEHLVFNSTGQLTSETDCNGIGLALTYNGSGQLASVTDHAGRKVTFSYNGQGLLAAMALPLSRTVSYAYDGSGQLTSVTDPQGKTTTYTYDAQGLLASITNEDGKTIVSNTYDSSGRVVQQVNALGGTATFSYANGTTTYTDPAGNQWQDVYSGNVLVERIDPAGNATKYAYDANLNQTAITEPLGNSTTKTYDAAGNVTSTSLPSGATQSWTYDSLNDVTSHTDANGNTTGYSYDANGNLVKTTYADGASVSETRDPTTGAATAIIDALGNTTNYGYDAAGELTSTTSPLGEKTTYSYDAAGRVIGKVSPRGNASGSNPSNYTTSYRYDAENRLTGVTDPDGNTTSYSYDGVGNRTALTDPNGKTTSYGYDGDNQLVSVTDPSGAVATYGYDANGNRTSITTPLGNKTTYSYDSVDRLIKKTDPLGHSITYGYDADGNRASVTDAIGTTTSDTYDADNRLTGISYSDSTPAVSYSYDGQGNRTKMTDATGTTSYSYNSRSELTAMKNAAGTFSYAYDKHGDITSRTYPDGSAVSYTYDTDGQLASVAADGQTTTYAYNPDSELTSETLPASNGYTEAATYDPAGRVNSIADTNGSSTLTSYAYMYDAAGNPTKVVTNSGTITYSYDSNERLTNACYGTTCAQGAIAYTYDADGNRTKLVNSSGPTNYSYNSANQLIAAGTASYSYDADGRRTAAGATSYTYNAANELTKLATASGSTTYTYNGDGNRSSASSGGQTTDFVYDTTTPVPSLVLEQQSGSTVRRYVWGAGLISMRTGGSDYYVAHDEQGSVVGLISSTGNTEATYSYDPFGNQLTANTQGGAPGIALRYDAQYLDPTGLYHVGARQLDTSTGTFTTTDPLTPKPELPAISPYLYVNDQPTTHQDPSGQSSEGYQAAGGGGGGGTFLQELNACSAENLNACGYAAQDESSGINNSVKSYHAFDVTPGTNLFDVVMNYF